MDLSTVVGDDSTQEDVNRRVSQLKNLIEQDYEKDSFTKRIAKLAGGVAVIQVGAQTETELKEKKLRVEDALNATKAAVKKELSLVVDVLYFGSLPKLTLSRKSLIMQKKRLEQIL